MSDLSFWMALWASPYVAAAALVVVSFAAYMVRKSRARSGVSTPGGAVPMSARDCRFCGQAFYTADDALRHEPDCQPYPTARREVPSPPKMSLRSRSGNTEPTGDPT